MASVTLGNFEADRAGLDTALLTVARNAYPHLVGWVPMPGLAEYGSGALPSECKGLFFAKTSAGAYQVYAGTATKLYKLVSGVWTDYSRTVGGAYAVPSGSTWRAAQYGNLLIAVNGADAPQVLDIDTGATAFSALAGSPPVARDISVVGDFVFLLDATNYRRLIWCGTTGPNTATSWTVGTDLCDEYIAPDGGDLASPPLLGDFGLILQTGGVARRIILQPGDTTSAYRFEKLEATRGPVSLYAVAPVMGRAFILADDGFYAVTPDGASTPIGAQRVNNWFTENTDQARVDRVLAFADPYSTRVYWAAYATAGSTSRDVLLGYDWQLDRWFYSDGAPAVLFSPIAVPAATLESLDSSYPNLDTMAISLDARQFQGGRLTMAAVNASGKLAFLTGSNLEAEFKTAGGSLVGGKRAVLRWIEPKGEFGSSTVTVAVGKREYDGATRTETAFASRSSRTGRIQVNASARVHDFRVKIAAGGDWSFAQSLETVEQPDGDQ